MDPHIFTPRLVLTRLTDTDLDSQHLQWFHKNCSDKEAMAWSPYGICASLEESREWMIKALTEYDNMFYAVHLLDAPVGNLNVDNYGSGRGEFIGTVNLRLEGDPVFPPPPRPQTTESPSQESSTDPNSQQEKEKDTNIKFRALGYQFFKPAWGKGYATEANAALISAYKQFVNSKAEPGYIEAHIDLANMNSAKVVEKLGFSFIGAKKYMETVNFEKIRAYEGMLGWREVDGKKKAMVRYENEWREPGFSAYGLWV